MKSKQIILHTVVLSMGISLATGPAQAANRYWVAGDGAWSHAPNWSSTSGGAGGAGQPQTGDNVYLTQTDAVDRAVGYFNLITPVPELGFIRVDATGTGNMTLIQNVNHQLIANYEYIGYNGAGIYRQSAGTNTIKNILYLGLNTGSYGHYQLFDGTLAAGYESIGDSGIGSFGQFGGTHSVTNNLALGWNATGSGAYHLNAGTLNVGGDIITGSGYGGLYIDGGTLHVGGGDIGVTEFAIGVYGSGSHSLSGTDTVTAGNEYIGTGVFTQSGGTNTVTNDLMVGYGGTGSGSYTLSGGSLAVNRDEWIGHSGIGVFSQTGGTHSVTEDLWLGSLSTGSGTYTLNDGTLVVGGGIKNGQGSGRLNIDGGTLAVAGGIEVDELYLGSAAKKTGNFELSGTSSLVVESKEVIGGVGRGVFTQTGGTHEVTGTSNGAIITGGNLILGETVSGLGEFSLSGGSLSTYGQKIGLSGTGIFSQSGGTNQLLRDLALGVESSGNGTYHLSNGTLDMSLLSIAVGVQGTGKFIQTGGIINDLNELDVGGGSSGKGTYELSGQGILRSAQLMVGYSGQGVFNQRGGFNENLWYMHIGSSESGHGTYNLSGGTLSGISQKVGVAGEGVFTQSGGIHSVSDTLSIGNNSKSTDSGLYDLQGGLLQANAIELNEGGIFNQTGGTLEYGTFTQQGGEVQGNFHNASTFNYTSGLFSGRLVNQGTANLNGDFTAGNGIDNQATLNIAAGQTVAANGAGLENSGSMRVSGALAGDGPLANFGTMNGSGEIGGSNGFVNYGSFAPGSGFVISNTGANANYGNMTLASYGQLRLTGATLANRGGLHLNNSLVIGTGTLENAHGGTISGRGTIASSFNNAGGVLLVESGATNITREFANSGLVQMAGHTATLSGGTMNNSGTVEGYGHVGNNIKNEGTLRSAGGTLSLGGYVDNRATMRVMDNSTMLVTAGLAENTGVISLSGGTFDNNNHAMTSNGQISGHGTIMTGGLTNRGSMTLTGGHTTVNGHLTNSAGSQIEVAHDPAIFTGNVVNNGTFKLTHTTVTFTGSYTENGLFFSDPSTTYLTDVTINETGYYVGGVGDEWFVSGDFLNYSLQNTLWNTGDSLLGFNGSGDQTMLLAGVDFGATRAGYADNFAWGNLFVGSGTTLHIADGNSTTGGALYAGVVNLGRGVDMDNLLVSYILSDYNIYYDSSLAGNAYLGGKTFSLAGAGYLMPTSSVPIPGGVLLLGAGLAGLMGVRTRKNSDG